MIPSLMILTYNFSLEVPTLARPKRDLSDAMIMPGTRWCGRGWTADRYYELVTTIALKKDPVK